MNDVYGFDRFGISYQRAGEIALLKFGGFKVYEKVGTCWRFLSFIIIEFKHEL